MTDKPTLDFLKSLSPDYQAIKGDFDMSPSLPLNKVVNHGQLRLGFISGHSVIPNGDPDALLIAARQLDVDMLIYGGTHRVEAYQLEGKFFVNPGTATGAFYSGWPDEEEGGEEGSENSQLSEDPIPSFCLLDIQGSVCILYIYSYVDGDIKVDKISYRKDMKHA